MTTNMAYEMQKPRKKLNRVDKMNAKGYRQFICPKCGYRHFSKHLSTVIVCNNRVGGVAVSKGHKQPVCGWANPKFRAGKTLSTVSYSNA